MNFVTRTVPYIFSTRDYFNSSILGNGVYYGLPMWLILLLRIVFAVLAVASLWLLYRYYRTRDPLFWMLTSSGVLLIASLLVLSLGQAYYSMMLFPFLMTVVLPNSVIRNWVAWLAIYGFMTMDRWLLCALADDGPLPGVHEDHLRLVADADRGVLRAATSATSTPRTTAGCERRHRPAVDDGRSSRALALGHDLSAPQSGTDRRRVAREAQPRGVRGAAPGRHRAAVHRRVHRHQDRRRLRVPGLWRRTVPQHREVRIPLRLAVFLRPGRLRRGDPAQRRLAGHDTASRCCAPTATATWATSSRARATRRRPTSATASTRSRCGWCRASHVSRCAQGRNSRVTTGNPFRRDQGRRATSSSTATRGPVKNGVSSRTCRRASVARRSRIRSTMRCSSGASKARIHS